MVSAWHLSTRFFWLLGALTACAVAVPAQADYRYTYTGNPFTVTNSELVFYDQPEFITYDSESTVTAVLYSHSLLTPGAMLSDLVRFTLTRNDVLRQEVLEYPYPYAGPLDPPGSSGNPINEGTFSIGAVDGSGLPTDWNIGINFSYRAPTGREFALTFATSTALDSVAGGYEGFTSFAGALANQPGQWSVSAVPEPNAAWMFLAGLAFVGATLRRRSTQPARPMPEYSMPSVRMNAGS